MNNRNRLEKGGVFDGSKILFYFNNSLMKSWGEVLITNTILETPL